MDVSLAIVRFASWVIYAVAAYLCWRRWQRGHYPPWRVVGILATVLTFYRLSIFIIDLSGGQVGEELTVITTAAANVAFILGGLAIVYAVTYETPEP